MPDTPSPDAVYQLADIEAGRFPSTPLAVVGHPIKHSLSPVMHNAALAQMRRTNPKFDDWCYYKFDIEPQRLPEALMKFHACGFVGLNLTVPHKVEAVPYVAGLERNAKLMGAVNTLKRKAVGYHGYNTDGYGLAQCLLKNLNVRFKDSDIILLGAGGAARGAAVEALLSGCRSLWIGNRNQQRLGDLLDDLIPLAKGDQLHGFEINNPPAELPRDGVLINATSLGLKDTDPAPISLDSFRSDLRVMDMVYNPPETTLIKQARSRTMFTSNGLDMLIHQGAKALEIWSEATVPVQAMEEALKLI